MSVREYIGARYVPLFCGDWDNTQTYEPLSIVLYQGASYTSVQYVPTGIDISDTDFWALTGNYNAQVEAYRQEVLAYNGRITANEGAISTLEGIIPSSDYSAASTVSDAISDLAGIIPSSDYSTASTVSDAISAEAAARANEDSNLRNLINLMTPAYLDKHMTVKSLNGDGALRLVKFDNHVVLIDCGSSVQPVGTFLSDNIGADDHVDMLVISHMHQDHVTGYSSVIPYVDSDTEVVLQMAPSASNDQYAMYQTYLAQILEAFPDAYTPTEGQSWSFGDLVVKINNTTAANVSLYDSTPANGGTTSGLNNYSLITHVSCPFGSYLDTADLEGVGEEMNAALMTYADVCLLPHHRVNNNGYLAFFKAVNPKLFTCVTRSTTANPTTPNAMRHWNGKVMAYMGVECLCDDIGISEFTISLSGLKTISGTLLAPDIAYQRFRPDLYLAVNATYYDRDPESLATITLQDFCNLYAANGDVFNIDPNEYLVGTATFMTQVRSDLRTLIGAGSSDNIRIQMFGGYMDAFVNSLTDNKRARITYTNYYSSPSTGYKIMDNRSHRLVSELTTAAASYTVPDDDLAIAYDNDVIYAHLSGGQYVPMFPYNATRTVWAGSTFTGAYNCYVARLNLGVLTAAQVSTIGSGTAQNVYGIRTVL